MKYGNVFYVPHFNIIGGIETYCYELAKKYKDKETYLVIDDETDDVDSPEQIEILNKKVSDK